MNEPRQKNPIYKNVSHTTILDHKSNDSKIKRVMTKNVLDIRYKFGSIRKSSPHDQLRRISEKVKKSSDSFKQKGRKLESPYINFNEFSKSPEAKKNTNELIPVKKKNNINEKKLEYETKVKMIFYFLISTIYLSLYYLCTKILFGTPMPYIPPIGTSLFIISFNNAILSIIFIILDQIDYLEYLYFEKLVNNFLKMIFNFSVILLTIKSLENINLLSFIILINMKPIIISFLNIRESNKSYNLMDISCYFLFGLIGITEFIIENKISIITTFILIIIDTFDSFAKLNTNTLHPYLTTLGCSIIGISISPLVMIIRRDLLIISFSQYLLFLIISLTHFLNIYFLSKYNQYSFEAKFKIINIIFIYFLFIVYSFLLLRENNNWSAYIFFIFSLLINNYAILSNDTAN